MLETVVTEAKTFSFFRLSHAYVDNRGRVIR